MNIIMVDHEVDAVRNFELMCDELYDIHYKKGFIDPLEVINYVKNERVDIAFLDIEMPEMTGIELARRLKVIKKEIAIVFVTEYEQYALKAFEVGAIGYILKPFDKETIQQEINKVKNMIHVYTNKRVYIRTFRYFDVLIDGVSLHFSSSKAKELLALLVDQKGGAMTMDQIITQLWADRVYDQKVKALYRMTLKKLRETLKAANIEYILIDKRNSRSINMNTFECDYYKLLDLDETAIRQYNGRYMSEYSWAEYTTAYIENKLKITSNTK